MDEREERAKEKIIECRQVVKEIRKLERERENLEQEILCLLGDGEGIGRVEIQMASLGKKTIDEAIEMVLERQKYFKR
jgi:hypothetical protein